MHHLNFRGLSTYYLIDDNYHDKRVNTPHPPFQSARDRLVRRSVVPGSPVLGYPRQDYHSFDLIDSLRDRAEPDAGSESSQSTDELQATPASAAGEVPQKRQGLAERLDNVMRSASLPPASWASAVSGNNKNHSEGCLSARPEASKMRHAATRSSVEPYSQRAALSQPQSKRLTSARAEQPLNSRLVLQDEDQIYLDINDSFSAQRPSMDTKDDGPDYVSSQGKAAQSGNIWEIPDDHASSARPKSLQGQSLTTKDRTVRQKRVGSNSNQSSGNLAVNSWLIKDSKAGGEGHEAEAKDNSVPNMIARETRNQKKLRRAEEAKQAESKVFATEESEIREKESVEPSSNDVETAGREFEETVARERDKREVLSRRGKPSKHDNKHRKTVNGNFEVRVTAVNEIGKKGMNGTVVENDEGELKGGDKEEPDEKGLWRRTSFDAGVRQAELLALDAANEELKRKERQEKEDRDALEAAKLELKEKNDRISREWEEKKAAMRSTDQIVATANLIANRGANKQRVSTTPLIPKGIRSSATPLRGSVALAKRLPVNPVGIDAQVPLPRTVKRTVSFVDEIKPQPEGLTHPGELGPHDPAIDVGNVSSTQTQVNLKNDKVVTTTHPLSNGISQRGKETVKKQTLVLPPGIGPQDPQMLSLAKQERPVVETGRSQPKPQRPSSKAPVEKKTQTTLKAGRGVKGKVTGRITRRLSPIIKKSLSEEVVISSEDESSVSSYYSSGAERSRAVSQEQKEDVQLDSQNSQVNVDADAEAEAEAEACSVRKPNQSLPAPALAPDPADKLSTEAQSLINKVNGRQQPSSSCSAVTASSSARSASSSASSARSSTRSPVRYVSVTPSDSVREDGRQASSLRTPSKSSTIDTGHSSIVSRSTSNQETESTEKEIGPKDGTPGSEQDMPDSIPGTANDKIDESQINESSIPVPPVDKQDLDKHLQDHARQSSQPLHRVSSQRGRHPGSSQPIGSNGISSSQARPNGSVRDHPRLTDVKTNSIRHEAGVSARGTGKRHTPQLSSQLQGILRHPAPSSSMISSRNGSRQAGSDSPSSSDASTDSDEDSDSDSNSDDQADVAKNKTAALSFSTPQNSQPHTSSMLSSNQQSTRTVESSNKGKVANRLSGLLNSMWPVFSSSQR